MEIFSAWKRFQLFWDRSLNFEKVFWRRFSLQNYFLKKKNFSKNNFENKILLQNFNFKKIFAKFQGERLFHPLQKFLHFQKVIIFF